MLMKYHSIYHSSQNSFVIIIRIDSLVIACGEGRRIDRSLVMASHAHHNATLVIFLLAFVFTFPSELTRS